MPFFILFIVIPLIELFLFLTIGDAIGLLATLIICVVTAIVGGVLVKHQGMKALSDAKLSLSRGIMPIREIFDGFCIVVAGALLMTPGFLTDFIGFAFLIPFLRTQIRTVMAKSERFRMAGEKNGQKNKDQPRAYYSQSDIIEGDIVEADYQTMNENEERK